MEHFLALAFQLVVFGLLAGSVYSLLGLGLTLIMGVGKILNVSHGDLGILGAYLAFVTFVYLRVDPLLSLVLVMPVLALLGISIQKYLIEPAVKDPKYQITVSVMITYGISLAISNGLTIIASPDYKFLALSYAYKSVAIMGTTINLPRLLVLIVTAIVALCLFGLMKTKLGKSVQAASQDQMLASLIGINTRNITEIAFGLSTALAAIAGVLYLLNNPLYPSIGLDLTVEGLTVMVMGGIGNIFGALAAGLIIGLIESITSFFIGDIYRSLVVYCVLIVVLLLRPSGIFRSLEG